VTNLTKHRRWSFDPSFQSTTAVLAIAIVLVLAPAGTRSAQAQTFTVLHTFTGGGDGAHPYSTPMPDAAGNLYDTTTLGGPGNCTPPYECGTVFKLSRKNSGWVLQTLYTFDPTTGTDGYAPLGQLARDRGGILYGTTQSGGPKGDGTVFQLRPAATRPVAVTAPWMETRIQDFDSSDGELPEGDLLLDAAGNLYGTTCFGGANGLGTVFKLTPSDGAWGLSVLHSFTGGYDGGCPKSGVVLDAGGNVYGTAYDGGTHDEGLVYQVTPSGSLTVLYSFTNGSDGSLPTAGLTFDSSGNLYGATAFGGSGGSGVVFELSPSDNGWTYSEIYPLPGGGWGPYERLVMDASGNLYGTMYKSGSSGYGVVFKLTPSNGSWTYAPLHIFTGGDDGAYPSGLVLDSAGNLYGVASYGGTSNYGVVFEITR